MKSKRTADKRMRDVGEDAVIRALLRVLGRAPGGTTGPGDDCAVVPLPDSPWEWHLTSDPVVEGIHFLADTPPRAIGHKAVGRVLSDLAAMGSEPQWLLIDVTAPPDYPVRALQDIYRGASRLAKRCGATIMGGDVGKAEQLSLHVFGIGQAPVNQGILRRGARAGDFIFVSGRLGGSLLGRHLKFIPRVAEGQWLRTCGGVTAMMDISDGLATDLPRLLALNGLGAELEAASIPIHPDARRMEDTHSDLYHALTDGEDFELLFTVSPRHREQLESDWKATFKLPCRCIGRITGQAQQFLIQYPDGRQEQWTAAGFQHFVSGEPEREHFK